jgi:hypothetical protein
MLVQRGTPADLDPRIPVEPNAVGTEHHCDQVDSMDAEASRQFTNLAGFGFREMIPGMSVVGDDSRLHLDRHSFCTVRPDKIELALSD